MDIKKDAKVVNIFWTGGLDSTFRVVQLLRKTNHTVQPHYLIFGDNVSGIEIDAMIKMRRKICEKYPDVKIRFLPTIYTNAKHISINKEIDAEVARLRKEIKVIDQYYFMANYCKAHNINEMEVAIVYLEGEMELFVTYKDSLVFTFFSYPIIDLSKKVIYDMAVKEGWEDIINMTSFCKRPFVKIRPCGVCAPCTTAVMDGMGFRLPYRARLIGKLQLPFRNYIREHYSKFKDNKLLRWIERKVFEY